MRTLGYPFRFVELDGEINQRMPAKPDVADERGSPAVGVAKRLGELGADLAYHDPYIGAWQANGHTLACEADLDRAVIDADCVVLLQPHRAYDLSAIAANGAAVLDTRGVMTGASVERL